MTSWFEFGMACQYQITPMADQYIIIILPEPNQSQNFLLVQFTAQEKDVKGENHERKWILFETILDDFFVWSTTILDDFGKLQEEKRSIVRTQNNFVSVKCIRKPEFK